MRIIEATWDKRNFGIDTYEIELDIKDLKNFDKTFKDIKDKNFKNSYVTIKLPVGNLDALHKLEDDGYRFMETQLYLVQHFQPEILQMNSKKDVKNNISVEVVPKDKEAWENVINNITPGMFDKDRISLDPKLGLEIACKRYKNWCRDLFENPNSEMIVRKYNNEIFGFSVSILDKERGTLDGLIGGIFEKYKDLGLGSTWMNDFENSPDKNYKTKTAVSSNNLSVLKIHQHCGRIIYKERYVLRKIYP